MYARSRIRFDCSTRGANPAENGKNGYVTLVFGPFHKLAVKFSAIQEPRVVPFGELGPALLNLPTAKIKKTFLQFFNLTVFVRRRSPSL